MLSNAYFLAKFRLDTAENEPAKNLQKFCKNLLILQTSSSAAAANWLERTREDELDQGAGAGAGGTGARPVLRAPEQRAHLRALGRG